MDSYFVITSTEDGISIMEMREEELLQRIDENYWGEKMSRNFFNRVPAQDKGCFMAGEGLLIIRGHVVVPKPLRVVEKFQIADES